MIIHASLLGRGGWINSTTRALSLAGKGDRITSFDVFCCCLADQWRGGPETELPSGGEDIWLLSKLTSGGEVLWDLAINPYPTGQGLEGGNYDNDGYC